MAFTEAETDALAGKIARLALLWAGGDPGRLAEAITILETSPVLDGPHEAQVIDFERARTGLRGTMPGEVCVTCSDPEAGNWVPVSFCPVLGSSERERENARVD